MTHQRDGSVFGGSVIARVSCVCFADGEQLEHDVPDAAPAEIGDTGVTILPNDACLMRVVYTRLYTRFCVGSA